MSNLSNILNSKYPSPTTFVGSATSSSGVSYTATSPVKANINVLGSNSASTISINSNIVTVPINAVFSIQINFSSGQNLNVTAAVGATALVSVERSN